MGGSWRRPWVKGRYLLLNQPVGTLAPTRTRTHCVGPEHSWEGGSSWPRGGGRAGAFLGLRPWRVPAGGGAQGPPRPTAHFTTCWELLTWALPTLPASGSLLKNPLLMRTSSVSDLLKCFLCSTTESGQTEALPSPLTLWTAQTWGLGRQGGQEHGW